MLSYCQVGRPYPVAELTTTQKRLVKAMTEIGIIYTSKDLPRCFVPTETAVSLIYNNSSIMRENLNAFSDSDASASRLPQNMNMLSVSRAHMRIIVETNMQVVAYVSNELHLALLKLFVDVHVRMPNMVMGTMTRDKAKRAFQMGIKVSQVENFLSSHAHPATIRAAENAGSDRLVPINVIEQLEIWERENHRVSSQEAVVVNFAACGVQGDLFEEILRYAGKLKACLWVDRVKLVMALTVDGYKSIQAFVKERPFST